MIASRSLSPPMRAGSYCVAAMALLSVLTACETKPAYRYEASWTSAGDVEFVEPFAVAVAPRTGRIVVSDVDTRRVFILDGDGELVRSFGGPGDGAGEFRRPAGVAIGADGSIYVSDFALERVQKFTSAGEIVHEWGEDGSAGPVPGASGLAVDDAGQVYVAGFTDQHVYRADEQGRIVERLGRAGGSGVGQLHYPTDASFAADGVLIVADTYNHRLKTWKRDAASATTDEWGVVGSHPSRQALHVPTGVAASPEGMWLHVADSANHRLVMLDRRGEAIDQWSLPEPGPRHSPTMVAVSPDGRRVYVTDPGNGRVIVLRVESGDKVRDTAGVGRRGY